jgi:fatty-acyl-CoA synthase
MTPLDTVATYAASRPTALAVVDLESGRPWSYAELNGAVDRLATWMTGEWGPRSGVRIATLARNCAEMLILHLACNRAGAIFVPFNWRLAPAEIAMLAGDARPELLFHDPEFAAPANIPRARHIAATLNLGAAATKPALDARPAFDAATTLLYTSGTSGRPKGVKISESNIFWSCANFNYGSDVGPRSVFLCDMPMFHTAGLITSVRAPLQAGATVLISKGFDPQKTLARLSDPGLRVTHYFSVPQMAGTLWNQPGFDPGRLRGLVSWTIGGAPCPKALSQKLLNVGIRITEGYGMSETCSNLGMPPHDMDVLRAKAGSCGLPFLSVETLIVDHDGREVPAGQVGELWVRGPSVTSGYWNQPDATAKVFSNGWFMTGDAAMKDDEGFHYIVDRKKDMYISGGENVYPAEVEAAIAELPHVAECAVVGVPDERWGEVGRVYVIPVVGRRIMADEVLAFCTQRLAKFKVPKTAVITDTLPRTASGKLQKHLLKQRALEELSDH